jgi:sterol desaturase/sphingolipid hydroxylase (fatty acid hydroxylase superfamily)
MGIIQASIPLFLLLIALEWGYARAGRRPFYRLADSITDLSCGILSQLAGIATKLVTVGCYAWVATHASLQRWVPLVPAWPTGPAVTALDGPPWITIQAGPALAWVVAFVAVDLCYYWFHRASHEVHLLWAGHVVHHSSEEYNLTVALRQSALGGLLSWVFYLPLAVLGLPVELFAACYALNLVYQFWIHTRAVGVLPAWLEAVWNTPSHHRVHHGVNPAYQDRNYAGVFIVWDRWFGTFTPEAEPPVYGITHPLRSWNPLWANVHGYVEIARAAWRADRWTDRWHIVFGHPGWCAPSPGDPGRARSVGAGTPLRYDPPTPRGLSRYATGHFLVTLVAAFALLTRASALPLDQLGAGAFYVTVSLTAIGGVLERRRWAFPVEQARLVALAAACGWLGLTGRLPTWAAVVSVAAAAASWLVLFRARGQFTVESDESMDLAPASAG